MKKIALIEDDTSIREMYQMKLEMEGYNVVCADDGEKALEVIKKENPDLVLLDILMPKKDGFEVLKELKDSQDSGVKSIPVVMLTNLSNREDIAEAEKLGAVDYLVKAKITPSEVADKVESLVKSQ